jgi:hypothetical protein
MAYRYRPELPKSAQTGDTLLVVRESSTGPFLSISSNLGPPPGSLVHFHMLSCVLVY